MSKRLIQVLTQVVFWSVLFSSIPVNAVITDDSTKCEVLVYGDSLAGVGVAVSAARLGADVCMLATVGYAGGQASAASVSTMDEGHSSFRDSGLYKELIEELTQYYGAESLSSAYYGKLTNTPTVGAEPVVIRRIFDNWLDAAGVRVYKYVKVRTVLQDGNRVVGLIDQSGHMWSSKVLVDASELQELYPHVNGLDYEVGDGTCIQDITWTVNMKWYPDGVPGHLWVPLNTYYQLRAARGSEVVDSWLDEFRSRVVADGQSANPFPGWEKIGRLQLNFDAYAGYRATADKRELLKTLDGQVPMFTRTSVNWSNDMQFLLSALQSEDSIIEQYQVAQDKTLLFLWYLRRELREKNWGIADDQEFERVKRPFNNPLITDRLESNFPPTPYIREGRRLTNTTNLLTYQSVSDDMRGRDHWKSSVMVGAYFSDTHSCELPPEQRSGYGAYDVPLGIFVPRDIDGFLPGMARGAGVDRAVASSIRMQPTELIGGQVVGTIAAVAAMDSLSSQEITADRIRNLLKQQGVVIDVPR